MVLKTGSTSDGTRNLGSSGSEWNNIYAKTNIFVNGFAIAVAKFGGTGADGALTLTSGTTTLSGGSATYLEKNYTSISITGTGKLAFSNPHSQGTIIRLRCQGGVTLNLTGTAIDLAGMGGAGQSGTSGVVSNSNAGGFGGGSSGGAGGVIANTSGGGSTGGAGGGSGGGQGVNSPGVVTHYGGQFVNVVAASLTIAPGGGGGGGSGGWSNSVSPGNGGSGGTGAGALIIECAGAYNFTSGTVISGVGVGGSAGTINNGIAGGTGGGGGGGNVIVLYNTLTADAGTYTLTGGVTGSSGANGVAVRALNTYFA